MSVLGSHLPLKEFFRIQGTCHTPNTVVLTFCVNVSIKSQQAMKTAMTPMSFARIRPFVSLWTKTTLMRQASHSCQDLKTKSCANRQGLQALDGVLQRSIDPLLKREGKARLILDLDSSEDPAHGRQEGVNYNGHFRKNCYHPLFCFTSSGICLAGKLSEGNVHSAHGGTGDALPDRGEIPEALQAVLAPWGRSLCQARTLCLLRGKEDDLLHPAEIEQHLEKSH